MTTHRTVISNGWTLARRLQGSATTTPLSSKFVLPQHRHLQSSKSGSRVRAVDTEMKQGAFVSSWLPGLNSSAPRSRSAKCHVSPQMSIVSHEKLQVLFESENSELAQYKIELEIPASHSKEKRKQSIQALRKNADFKGFRKGTIPPFIMKDIPGFVLRDSIEELLEEALEELKLEKTDGDAADPDIDFEEMMGRFNVGEDFRFSLEMPLRKVLSLDTESLTQDILDVKSDVDLSDAESDALSRTAEAEASQPST